MHAGENASNSSTNNAEENDIPLITHRKPTNSEDCKGFDRSVKGAVLQLFISNVFGAKLETNKFTHRGFVFNNIKVRGTVVDYVNIKNNKLVITVDDGTGQIDCYYDRTGSEKLLQKRNDVENCIEFAKHEIQLESDRTCQIINEAVMVVLRKTKEKLAEIPHEDDIRLGDTVELVGKLTEYNNKRNVFINRIVKIENCDLNCDISHYEDMLDLHENMYCI